GKIIAVIDEYGDEIIEHIRQIIIRNGFDPVELPNDTLKLIPLGSCTLSDGWLQNLSLLSRDKDIEITYSSSRRIVELEIPIKFDALMFSYNYVTKVFPLTLRGGIEGKLSNVKVNIILSYNTRTSRAHLDKFDITKTGGISIRFTGNALLDWISNAMSSVITLFLKPIILNIVDWILKGSLDSMVDTINEFMKCLSHPRRCQL
ncbi:hypothetical protein JTB14_021768, partial [Gonioctena quinquepunctata]